MPAPTKIYFDGGLRPAGMEIAVVLRGVATIVTDLGSGTSMTAEWLALLHAAERARSEGLTDAILIGDAAAVVAQATGRVRIPPAHHVHAEQLAASMANGGRMRIRHVGRAQNLAGIALSHSHLQRLHL